jgi:murein DD-endopeptidase MepM/ murein hydrolase activator NlpD/beta-lactamase regulating signal transducer with metallopeptidase domain
MMADLARSPVVLALGAALLHSVWQIAAVAAALVVLLRILSGASAGARYLVACAALILAAAAPVATFSHLLPASPPPFADAPLVLLLTGAPHAPHPPPSLLAHALSALSLAWAMGALFMTLRLALGLGRVRRLVSTGTEPLPDAWQATFAGLSRRLGLSRTPLLLGSTRIDVPMAVGFFRPVVLVPLAILTSLPPASIEALLAHELAHLRRLDFAVNLLLSAVSAGLFYHPAAHWIARCVRTLREHAADDLAAPLFGHRRYAAALFELESFRGTVPEPALGSNGGSLMMRIQRLLAPRPPHAAHPRAALAPAVLALAALGLVAMGLGSCGSQAEGDTTRTAAEAAAEVHIRWLPPALAPYRAVFAGAAARHRVDADTLAIVALVESSGDPAAESSAGAVGLMQVMPRTGAQIAAERGLADFGAERLRDPEYNVDFGAWYFAQQLAVFRGDQGERRAVELASAAYNAGPNAVRAYLAGSRPLPEETEQYKALVSGMWSEREDDQSPTFASWRARVQGRAATRARPPLSGGEVTLAFGEQWKGAAHQGVDIASPRGTPIAAPLDGVVIEAGADGDNGNVVVIRHRGGIETRYHHLGEIEVEAGQQVTQSTPIGTVGSSGKSTGPHVHFEVRDLGSPIDPTPYLDAATDAH